MADTLDIAIAGTPNPNAAKFTLNRVVASQGTTYRDAASAHDEWAKRLLGLPGVTQVFAINNFISVTKQSDMSWEQLAPQVEQVLRDAFA